MIKRIWKGWLREKLISLADQNRQVLTIRKPLVPTSTSQRIATHQASHGKSILKMNAGRQQAGRGGNRHAHKILAVRPPRIARLRVVADVEPRQPRNSRR